MMDRMVDAHRLLNWYGQIWYGSKYVFGRERWKIMIVNNLMYVCRALAYGPA